MLKRLLLSALVLLLAGCTVTYREAWLVSPAPAEPPRLDELHAEFPGHAFSEGRIESEGASLYTLAMTRSDARATVLYLGPNRYRIGPMAQYSARVYAPLPVNLVLVDHRGYGASTGTPTVDALMADALRVHDQVAGDPAFSGLPLVVHGHSLGSFMAGHVARHRRLGGLVLEGSATTTEEWVDYQRSRLPWWQRVLVRRVAPEAPLAGRGNLPVVGGLDEPVLFVVGEGDLDTPPGFSHRLYDATPLPDACRTLLVVPERGHNNATMSEAFEAAMATFVDRVADPDSHPPCAG